MADTYTCGDCLKFHSQVRPKEPIDMADKLTKGMTSLSSRPDVPVKAGQFHCPVIDDVVTADTPLCHRFAHKDPEIRKLMGRERDVDRNPPEETEK